MLTQPRFLIPTSLALKLGGDGWLTHKLSGTLRKKPVRQVAFCVDVEKPLGVGELFVAAGGAGRKQLKSALKGHEGWVPFAKLLREAPAKADEGGGGSGASGGGGGAAGARS